MTTKDRILESSLRLFNKEGADRVTVRSIASETGISHGNLTYHFPGKDEILYQLYLKLADEFNVPFLGEIPIMQSIREGGDSGNPVVVNHEEQIVGKAFVDLAGEVARTVAIRNANFDATRVVELVR